MNAWRPATLFKKQILTEVFPAIFAKFLGTSLPYIISLGECFWNFFQNFQKLFAEKNYERFFFNKDVW